MLPFGGIDVAVDVETRTQTHRADHYTVIVHVDNIKIERIGLVLAGRR